MKPKVNLLIATWSGNRYNQSKDYLKVLLKRVFELKHNLDQITVIIPLGSDNEEYYNVDQEIKDKIVFLHRPANDRSYGQFIYAYQQYTDQFDYYIICEDDYCPNIDNFDSILVDLIEEKKADYLCGKYAKQTKSDRDRAIQNQGIVKASSFKRLLECDPNPVFPVMGPEDGTEQLIFSEYFTNNGMVIKDYSDKYSVPYWAKTLIYWTENKDWNTIFVPYQCVSKNIEQHFLYNVQHTRAKKHHIGLVNSINVHYNTSFNINDNDLHIIEEPNIYLYPYKDSEKSLGAFKVYRFGESLFMNCYTYPNDPYLSAIMLERISWENRGENLYTFIKKDSEEYKYLLSFNWIVVEELSDKVHMCKDLLLRGY